MRIGRSTRQACKALDVRHAGPVGAAKHGRWRRGSAILEMSLTLMTLLYLSFGTVEYGYFFFIKNSLQGAAREGVRAAIPPSSSNTDVTAAINAALTAAGVRVADCTTVVKVNGAVADCGTATAGQTVEVSVTASWGTVGVRPLGLIGSTKSIVGGAAMRKESL